MFEGIDYASDTLTQPSRPMREAMLEAPTGDEQYGEDPTTNALQERVAGLLGTERALFFPSATMANEVAIRLHCRPGDELIAGENCHLFTAEAGGPAVHAGVQAKPIATDRGTFTGADIRRAFRFEKGPHHPRSRLVSVENTANMDGGVAWPLERLDEVVATAQQMGLVLHLDGARLFNAAVATGVDVERLARGFHSVTLCLSKGLGCPAGAILGFEAKHEQEVWRLKQLMGGSLRQSGILAAAGMYALDHNIARLEEDHANARALAQGLNQVDGIEAEESEPSTNMVFFRVSGDAARFDEMALGAGIRFSRVGEQRFRAVTHMDVSAPDIQATLDGVQKLDWR